MDPRVHVLKYTVFTGPALESQVLKPFQTGFFVLGQHSMTSGVRLINVHLDSWDIHPNRRPRQGAVPASLLFTADVSRGLIAGDWNLVSKEHLTLVRENRLVEAWEKLHPVEVGV